jgi:hypothetical protein
MVILRRQTDRRPDHSLAVFSVRDADEWSEDHQTCECRDDPKKAMLGSALRVHRNPVQGPRCQSVQLPVAVTFATGN